MLGGLRPSAGLGGGAPAMFKPPSGVFTPAAPAEVRDTTLLMAPDCLQDFLEFNDFLGLAEDVLEELDLDGTLVDSEKLWDIAMDALYERLGGVLTPQVRASTVGGCCWRSDSSSARCAGPGTTSLV